MSNRRGAASKLKERYSVHDLRHGFDCTESDDKSTVSFSIELILKCLLIVDKDESRSFPDALEKAGIASAGRVLVVHSFRHTYNTIARKDYAR